MLRIKLDINEQIAKRDSVDILGPVMILGGAKETTAK